MLAIGWLSTMHHYELIDIVSVIKCGLSWEVNLIWAVSQDKLHPIKDPINNVEHADKANVEQNQPKLEL